mmetsp:Transcript_37885/g.118159  ORF Transcript_37885/g.118159 Transcript_37885/m.118159 type:complete len:307 (-) Transcript_37885:182-1102(-)
MAPPTPLRVACLGDSWISDYERGEHADYWKLESHLPEAVLERLREECDRDVEFLVAGFPGFTASRLLQLAKLCRLRDLARVHDRRGVHLPAQGSLRTELWKLGVPCAWADSNGSTPEEDVDLVLIVAGYNDLKYGERGGADAVAQKLLQLRRLYASRGIEAIIVTIGEGSPCVERMRRRANRRLLAEGSGDVVSCDDLVRGLGREMWANMEHFTPDGYRAVGSMLGAVVAQRLREGSLCCRGQQPCWTDAAWTWHSEAESRCGARTVPSHGTPSAGAAAWSGAGRHRPEPPADRWAGGWGWEWWRW